MPSIQFVRRLAIFVCALVVGGCAANTKDGESGSLALDLVINGATEVDEVDWAITRGGMDIDAGTIDTSVPGATASLEAYGLLPGAGYTITMTATSVDGETSCGGSAEFDIEGGVATSVVVMLNCKPPQVLGAVRVNGKLNVCADLVVMVVSPLETSVGNHIELSAVADDAEGDDVAYLWEGTDGSFENSGAADTNYTCEDVGNQQVRVTVSDDDFDYCESGWTVTISCVEGDEDLCEGVTCEDDGNECTGEFCSPATGQCGSSPVNDGTLCNLGAGLCSGGTCVDADLCIDVQCPDLGECQNNGCAPDTGECIASNVSEGTPCNQGAGLCTGGTCVESLTTFAVDASGTPAGFTGQLLVFTVEVANRGQETLTNVVLADDLPDEGTLVSSDPPGSLNGNTLTFDLGDLPASSSVMVTITWQAPSNETTLVNSAEASADNEEPAADDHVVEIGLQTTITGGVTAAGTGLRNRDNGEISITGVPSGAVVTRAVLVWALLYTSPVPSDQITFEGQLLRADVTQTISSDLCWSETSTIGYAADVTGLVSGNGVYSITDPVNGIVREDSNPIPVFPVTDGASLFVFYGGAGFNNQVLSDFSYSAEGDILSENVRTLTDIASTGGPATLYLAGPDGQGFAEQVRVTGAGVLNLDNSWDGSDPQEGPEFAFVGGSLWDTDVHDVSSIVPPGQTTLDISLGLGSDCTGVSAVALQVGQ